MEMDIPIFEGRAGCHNFTFGLMTKAKACKGEGQE